MHITWLAGKRVRRAFQVNRAMDVDYTCWKWSAKWTWRMTWLEKKWLIWPRGTFIRSQNSIVEDLFILDACPSNILHLPYQNLLWSQLCTHFTLIWNVPLISPISWRDLWSFPFYFFSSISLHYSLKKAFLSLLAILWIFTFSWVSLSLFSLPFTSLLSSTICKAYSDNHSTFLYIFFFEIVLVTASCIMLWTLVHSSSDTLSIRSNFWIYSSPLLGDIIRDLI